MPKVIKKMEGINHRPKNCENQAEEDEIRSKPTTERAGHQVLRFLLQKSQVGLVVAESHMFVQVVRLWEDLVADEAKPLFPGEGNDWKLDLNQKEK